MPFFDETTLSALRERMHEYLETVCGITDLRRSFSCLNPEHEDAHPSMSFDPRTDRVHCFACEAGGDVFEVAGLVEGISDFPSQVEAVARAVGHPLPMVGRTRRRKPIRGQRKRVLDRPKPLADIDLIDGLQRATWTLLEEPQGQAVLGCLRGRGFTDAQIAEAPIGCVEHPSILFPCMRAPQCDDGYIVLGFPELTEIATTGAGTASFPYEVTIPYAVFRPCKEGAEPKEIKPPGLVAPIWREHLLTGAYRPSTHIAYVVEGIFDAMSLMALHGVQACATCGANTTRLLQIMACVPKDKRAHLILSFDSDKAGEKLTDAVSGELSKLGIDHSIAPPYPFGCKDANEVLMRRRGIHG